MAPPAGIGGLKNQKLLALQYPIGNGALSNRGGGNKMIGVSQSYADLRGGA